MKFRQATDSLLESVTLEDLAQALGASVQAVRQARASEGSSSHRSPPQGWEKAVSKLAREQAAKLLTLAHRLQS
jgi:hypothetical protein